MFDNRRSVQREPYSEVFDFSITVVKDKQTTPLELKGKAVDISPKGIGFHTTYPLEPGHILRVTMLFNGHKVGIVSIVKWTSKINDSYRIGAQFLSDKITNLLFKSLKKS